LSMRWCFLIWKAGMDVFSFLSQALQGRTDHDPGRPFSSLLVWESESPERCFQYGHENQSSERRPASPRVTQQWGSKDVSPGLLQECQRYINFALGVQIFFFPVLGFELRALHLLGRHSTT
jgi:hypothetical protein